MRGRSGTGRRMLAPADIGMERSTGACPFEHWANLRVVLKFEVTIFGARAFHARIHCLNFLPFLPKST